MIASCLFVLLWLPLCKLDEKKCINWRDNSGSIPFWKVLGLTAKELLVYFDDDGNGALSAAELATVFRFVKTEGKAVRRNEVPVLEEIGRAHV